MLVRLAPWLAALLCALPAAHLGVRFLTNDLGVNPIEELTRELGVWALRLVIASLAVTPLLRLTRQTWIARLRRPIGLMAFAYAFAHLSTYVGLDYFFDWAAIGKDLVKRPFITIGMAAMALLAPLALTSTNAMVRRIGPRAWKVLHRLAYVAAGLGVLHYLLLVKADTRPPLIYGAILAVLLGWRVYDWARKRAQAASGMSRAALARRPSAMDSRAPR